MAAKVAVPETLELQAATADSLKSETKSKATALHMAAEAGAPKIVEQLLKKAMAAQRVRQSVAKAEQKIQADEQELEAQLKRARTGDAGVVVPAGKAACAAGRFAKLVFDERSPTRSSACSTRCHRVPPANRLPRASRVRARFAHGRRRGPSRAGTSAPWRW